MYPMIVTAWRTFALAVGLTRNEPTPEELVALVVDAAQRHPRNIHNPRHILRNMRSVLLLPSVRRKKYKRGPRRLTMRIDRVTIMYPDWYKHDRREDMPFTPYKPMEFRKAASFVQRARHAVPDKPKHRPYRHVTRSKRK